jgi:oxaloacetate decarboxylase alpha subunit
MWVDLAKQIEDMGANSLCIKDMAGLLKPYVAFDLVSRLKAALGIPIHMQCHATTGMSTTTYTKAIEAGVDNVDTAISSMSMTYGHSATESLVAIFEGTERDTGLDIHALEEIASYFREVRKKYAQFEGSLRGVDSRILVAQVPGGMLTNLENQLREQNATEKLDAVLEEIPRVREELGFIPLVTPTSQIVGTQSVINVLMGERYKNVTKETTGVLRGEYGATPAPLDSELQASVLQGLEPITCRPADLLVPEIESLTQELTNLAEDDGIRLADEVIDDVLTYALFPQVALKFLANRDNPGAFEPAPSDQPAPAAAPRSATGDSAAEIYSVKVNGRAFTVEVAPGGDIVSAQADSAHTTSAASSADEPLAAALAGNVFQVLVAPGQQVSEGETVIVLEAMKMETEISAPRAGTVVAVAVAEGDAVSVGDTLLTLT